MEAFNIPSPHFREECICKPLHAACSPTEAAAHTPAQLEAENSSSSADKRQLRLETTFKKLEESSKAGCWFCSVLLAGIQDAAESHAGRIEETTRLIASDSPQYSLPLLLSIVSANENLDGFTSYEFYIPRKFYSVGYGNICACLRHAPEIPITTSSQESFAFAKEQLGKCIDASQSKHAYCESGIPFLPTRILQIEKQNQEYKVRLLISKGKRGKYVTLSHCWGAKMNITTTNENLNERVAGIDWNELSLTFQHAIQTTRELGFQYLWIDALCIIQGDLGDWQRESSQMHAVYSNCALMISADHAADGQGGCFNSPAPAPWSVRSGDCGVHVAVRKAKYHAGFYRANKSEFYQRLAPLATRAWAFQEGTLAPRTLHFGIDELIWACGGMVTCECGGERRNFGSEGGRKFIFKGCDIERFVEKIWYGLLGDYMPRLLTKPEDRLPAMSGLAKSFEEQWKVMKARYNAKSAVTSTKVGDTTALDVPKDPGMYLAGLWSNHLDTGLRWIRYPISDTSPLLPKPSQYLAPSWSWASINAPATYTSARKPIKEITFIHATCIPDGPDPMGPVKHGILKLSGPVIYLKLAVHTLVPDIIVDPTRVYVLKDSTRLDVSANFIPDYSLSKEDTELAIREGIDVCGLVMSEDFVMILKTKSWLGELVYERIGSLNYIEGWLDRREQPKKWAVNAVRKEITIV